jgi:hypothetical protein
MNMFGNVVAYSNVSSDGPHFFEAAEKTTETMVIGMTSKTKLPTATRKMKLLISFVTKRKYWAPLVLVAHAGVLLAEPHQEQTLDRQKTIVWTNDDHEKLHNPGLISIVGQIDEERLTPEPAPRPYVRTQDPVWYAAQAAKLADELERRQTQLSEYRKAINDAKSRKKTGGINLKEGELAITPEVGIEILERNVNEGETEINELEDLARRHDIPPGTLRGQ